MAEGTTGAGLMDAGDTTELEYMALIACICAVM